MIYTQLMTSKKTQAVKKVDYEPNKMLFAVVLLASVSLMVLTVVAVSSV